MFITLLADTDMNNVDFLLKSSFSMKTLDEKMRIKELGPHQPQNFVIQQQDKNTVRKFQPTWFSRKKWLTVSEKIV
jgi:hypothetical protein